jgi:hypothetical protein
MQARVLGLAGWGLGKKPIIKNRYPPLSPKLILMAKSEIDPSGVWQAGENRVCQGTGRREKDFAISIKTDEDPQNYDAVCPLIHCLTALYDGSSPPSIRHPALPEVPAKGEGHMPRVQYLVEEITFQREQGNRIHQLETVLTQRGDEGWELVTMITPEAQTEETSAGVRILRSANLLLVFKRV